MRRSACPGLLILLLLTAEFPASAAEPAPAPIAKQEAIYSGEATSILGRPVVGPHDEQVGRIVDVLVDEFGQPRAALIDFGGFMGVGERRIAVAWRSLHFLPAGPGPEIRIDLTIDQIKATPDWRRTERSEMGTMAAPPPEIPAQGK